MKLYLGEDIYCIIVRGGLVNPGPPHARTMDVNVNSKHGRNRRGKKKEGGPESGEKKNGGAGQC